MSMKKKTNLATNKRIHPKKQNWHELVKIQIFNTEWRDRQSGRKMEIHFREETTEVHCTTPKVLVLNHRWLS